MGSYMENMVRSVVKNAKQMALNLTEIEIKVEEATNNEPWGPHGGIMNEIAEAAYNSEQYKDIMGVLARRLQDKGENWRHVYKSLLLLEHMLKNGPMKVVHELRSNVSVIEGLQNFQYKDPKGKDHGINVRNRAKTLVDLTQDPDRIKQEREKAKQNRNKYGGVSSSDVRGGGGMRTGGFGGSNNSSSRYDEKFDSYDSYSSKSKYDGRGTGGDREREDRFEGFGSGSHEKAETKYDGFGQLGNKDNFSTAKSTFKAAAKDDEYVPPAQTKKKLSDTRVDPNIANAFSKMAIATPAAAQKTPAAMPAPVASAPADTGWDAFASPSPAPQAAAAAATPSSAPAPDGWDAFAAAPAPAAAAGNDGWDAFASAAPAPAPAVAAAPTDPFAVMSELQTAVPTAMPPVAPLQSNDPFASMSPAAAPAAPAPTASQTAPAALPADLFGPAPPNLMGGMGGMQQPQMGGMGMGMGGGMQQPQMGGGYPQAHVGGFGAGMMGGGMGGMQQPQIGGRGMGMGMGGGMQQPQMGGGFPQGQMAGMGMGMGGMQQPQMGGMGIGMPHQQPQQPQHRQQAPMGGVGIGVGMAPNATSMLSSLPAPTKKKDPFADLSGF